MYIQVYIEHVSKVGLLEETKGVEKEERMTENE
jgi:hypothetical protein